MQLKSSLKVLWDFELRLRYSITISMNGGELSIDDILNELHDKLCAVSDGHNDCDA